MKKNFPSLVATLLLLIGAETQAEECCFDPCCEDESDFYVEVLGGANFLQTSTDMESETTITQDILFRDL